MGQNLARAACVIALTFVKGTPIAATAQVAPADNQIVISKDVVGDAPPGSVFAIEVQCTAIDSPGGSPQLPGVSVVDQTVTFDENGNPPDVIMEIPAIADRDEGFVLCGVGETSATRAAILTPPTFVVSDPGTSRAADPQTDPVVGGPVGFDAGAQFPFTRSGAVVHVTFTNTYSPPPPPVVLSPTFTG